MFCIFLCDITSYIIWSPIYIHIYIYIHIGTVYDMFWLLYMLMVLYTSIVYYIIVFNIFHVVLLLLLLLSNIHIYIYIVLHHFILLIICLAQAFSQLFMDPAVDFSSVLFAMPPKREALNALLVTPPAPGGKTSCSRWSTGRVRTAPVCLAGLKRWAQNQYLAVPLFDWEVVADKPRNHFHASPFPSSLQEDEDSSFHAKTAMLSGLGLCNGAVHSSVPFRPACMSHVRMLQPVETREADPADVAMLRPSRSENLQSTISLSKKNQLRQRRQPWRSKKISLVLGSDRLTNFHLRAFRFSSQSGWCQSYSTKLGGIPDEADPASRFSCPGSWPQFCPPHAVIDACALPKPVPNVGTRR